MRSYVCHFLSYLLFVLCLQFCFQLSAQEPYKEITAPEGTSAWALHEQSGRIFAAVESADSVVEYDAAGQEVRKFTVEPGPTKMVVKGNRLVVGCEKGTCLSVIDLKTNKVAGKVDLGGKYALSLFCSKAKNEFVYGSCSSSTRGSNAELLKFDIAKLNIVNRTEARLLGVSYMTNVAVSADGNWIVPDNRGKLSPSGADLLKFDEEKFEFEKVVDHHSSFGQIEPGPANRYWTLGNKLYGLDLKEVIRNFHGTPTVIHPTYDLVTSFTSSSISFERFSNAEVLKKVPMKFTNEVVKSSARSRRSSSSSFAKSSVLVGYALRGSHVVVAGGRTCRILDLNDLEIPLKPLLMLDMPSEIETTSEEQIKVPIALTNKSLNKKASFEIKRAPAGAKIVNNHVVWTPANSDIGQHSILVSAKVDDTTDDLTINVKVNSTKLKLNFWVTKMHVEPNGRYAVAWGQKMPSDKSQNGGFGFRHPNHAGPDEVAVLDLQTQKVIVQKPLAAGVQSAIVQLPYVFLIPKSGNVLFRFSKDTLGDSKRMFLKDKGVVVVPYMRNKVGVVTGDSNMSINMVDPETMKSSGTEVIGYNSNYRNGQQPYTNVAPGVINFRGKLINLNDGSVAAFQVNPGLQSLVPTAMNNLQSHSMHQVNASSKMFGRILNGSNIMSGAGASVAQLRNRQIYSTPHAPVAFAVRKESTTKGRVYETKTFLETLSLVDGAVLDSRVFDVSTERNSRNPYSNGKKFFAFVKELVYVNGNEIFVLPIVKSVVDGAPVPLHFPYAKVDVLGIDRPEKISFKAKGGKGKIEYQLVTEYPGIDINASTGEVSLDTPEMWKNYLETYRAKPKDAMEAMRMRNSNNTKTLTHKQYEEKMGSPLPKDKIAFVVPIQVAATDDEAQEDRIGVFAIVHAPKNALDAKDAEVSKLAADERKRREEQMAAARLAQQKRNEEARLAREKEMAEKVESSKSVNVELEARMEALEQRSRRIEAALDAVLGKLEKMEKAQGGK